MSSQEKTIESLASQCVKCGLCLEHCPTYGISQDESESPRGRIALMAAMAKGELEPSQRSVEHLNQCLQCCHCERVCPAHVNYSELIATSHAWMHDKEVPWQKPKLSARFFAWIVRSNRRVRWVGRLLRALEVTQLRRLATLLGLPHLIGLNRLNQLLPKVPSQKSLASQSSAHPRPKVGLFLGCLSQWCDKQTPQDTIKVVQACGYDVVIPEQTCCGAIAFHQGEQEDAKQLAKENRASFEKASVEAIITTASGCGSQLQESGRHFHETFLSDKTIDASDFVLKHLPKDKLKPLKLTIGLHSPCTLQNQMKSHQQVIQLLNMIPGVTIHLINDKSACCGSAGVYMLEHPQMADELAQKLVDKVSEDMDVVVSSNIGCALHLGRALKGKGKAPKVLHPMSILAMALQS